jgi:hypothetical protein
MDLINNARSHTSDIKGMKFNSNPLDAERTLSLSDDLSCIPEKA